MIIYVASYATGLGNVPWQQGELFALEVRGIGTSLATTTNWAGNLLIGATYLFLMDAITPAGAFGLYSVICLLCWLFCVFCFPETAGLSLEEVRVVFRNGFDIRESERLCRAKLRTGEKIISTSVGATSVWHMHIVRRFPLPSRFGNPNAYHSPATFREITWSHCPYRTVPYIHPRQYMH